MVIKAKSETDTGAIITLTGNQNLLVGKGILLESLDEDGVFAASGTHEITVAGSIVAEEAGLRLIGNGNSINIAKGGEIISHEEAAILIEGGNARISNRGSIVADEGIRVFGAAGTTRIDNFGLMVFSSEGVSMIGVQSVVMRNFGQLLAPDVEAVFGGERRDVVVNRGLIVGDVVLDAGNDLYDGRKGTLRGEVFGGAGNDLFQAGSGGELFLGGVGFDTLDYRDSGAVRIALDNAFLGEKAAKGDRFFEIERVFGSAKGSDLIVGDDLGNDLRGSGGHDTIRGGLGSDTVIGGAGQDILNVGGSIFEFDVIVFNNLSEAGDRVSGFTVLDKVQVDASNFGGGLALGLLAQDRFKTGGNNQASDANDRFIFRTGDDTLWFDRDGSRDAFRPVLLADFADDTVVVAANINII